MILMLTVVWEPLAYGIIFQNISPTQSYCIEDVEYHGKNLLCTTWNQTTPDIQSLSYNME